MFTQFEYDDSLEIADSEMNDVDEGIQRKSNFLITANAKFGQTNLKFMQSQKSVSSVGSSGDKTLKMMSPHIMPVLQI